MSQGVMVTTRPDWGDLPMKYGHSWFKEVVDKSREIGWRVTDLEADQATRINLEATLINENPLYFTGVGHGNEDTYTGQELEILLAVGLNEEIMSGRVVYLLSCLTGVALGPALIANKCKAFLGYRVSFTWLVDTRYDPEDDPKAASFKYATNTIALSLASGYMTLQAYKAGIKAFDDGIELWSQSEDPEASEVIHWLAVDRDGFVLYGDKSAMVVKGAAKPSFPQLPTIIGSVGLMFGIGT